MSYTREQAREKTKQLLNGIPYKEDGCQDLRLFDMTLFPGDVTREEIGGPDYQVQDSKITEKYTVFYPVGDTGEVQCLKTELQREGNIAQATVNSTYYLAIIEGWEGPVRPDYNIELSRSCIQLIYEVLEDKIVRLYKKGKDVLSLQLKAIDIIDFNGNNIGHYTKEEALSKEQEDMFEHYSNLNLLNNSNQPVVKKK